MTMDLHKLWADQQAKGETPSEWNETDLKQLKERSDSPIQTLKRNIRINSAFAIIFALAFIVLMIFIDGFWFRLFTAIVALAYIAGIFLNRWIIKKYLSNIPFDDNLLHRLKAICIGINKSFTAIEYSSILIYPIAMTSGFLVPLTMEGKLNKFNEGPELWVILLACYVILTPLCFWLGKVLNRMAFGKYLKQIEGLVAELEQGEN